jgi:dihydropteroate synthase
MAILNVTPDSFSDGGRYIEPQEAVRRAWELIEEGADLLDVGGESTRPGAEPVPAEQELLRVLPVVEAVVKALNVPVSVDTMKPEVAEACLARGARIVNDVSGLRNEEMIRTVARYEAAAVVMHMRGLPRTMQQDTRYGDLIGEIRGFLADRVEAARAAGVRDVAVDPGIGFGKNSAQNFEILKRLGEFRLLGCPVLVGPSRKSFLGELAGEESVEARLEGTLAACVIAALNGASVVRVHDVAACRKALQVADAVRKAEWTESA